MKHKKMFEVLGGFFLAITLAVSVSIECIATEIEHGAIDVSTYDGWNYYIGENCYLYSQKGNETKVLFPLPITNFCIAQDKISVLSYENGVYQRFEASLLSNELEFIAVVERPLYDAANDKDGIYLFSASENEAYIFDFLRNTMGLNIAASCGIIANLYCENSSFEPDRRQGGGTGYGTYDDKVGYGICHTHPTIKHVMLACLFPAMRPKSEPPMHKAWTNLKLGT